MRPALLAASLLLVAARGASAADEPLTAFPAGWKEPQVAVGPGDRTFVVAAKDGVIAIVSASGRAPAFGAPVEVAKVEKLMCGMRRGPRIAVTEKAVVVT